MREDLTVTGMVLSAIPIGEYDKRLILLTRERGKIHVFARGARKQNSALMACSQPFTFGEFHIYEGKSAYNLTGSQVQNYFLELREDLNLLYYGFYFMELADYFARENMDGTEALKLLYQSFRALLSQKKGLEPKLIRYIFEWKILAIEGLMPQPADFEQIFHTEISPTVFYAMEYIMMSSVEKLYTFTLTDEAKEELGRLAARFYHARVDGHFRSLEFLE